MHDLLFHGLPMLFVIGGFFDSTSTTNTGTLAPSQSATVNALGTGVSVQTNQGSNFVQSSGNYAPDYSFSTVSMPTVNSTSNFSLQLASGSPGASFANSQTATSSSMWTWILAIGGVLAFFYFWKKHK